MTVTTTQIQQFRTDAEHRKDWNAVKLADRALRGGRAARIAVARAVSAATPSSEPTATERQVRYALDLQAAYWTPAVFGGNRYTREDLTALDRAEISWVIDTLLRERVA